MLKSSNSCHWSLKIKSGQQSKMDQLRNYGSNNYDYNNNDFCNGCNKFLSKIKNSVTQLRLGHSQQSRTEFRCNQGDRNVTSNTISNNRDDNSNNNSKYNITNSIHNSQKKKQKTLGIWLLLVAVMLLVVGMTFCQSKVLEEWTATAVITTQTVALSTLLHGLTFSTQTFLYLAVVVSFTTASAAAQSTSPQLQQRQFQQQQLFAMLTKNGHQSATGTAGSRDFGRDIFPRGVPTDEQAPLSLETIGFVSDDGDQRYEKAEKALAAAAAAAAGATSTGNRSQQNNSNNNNNNNNVNCPKECKCLNDYFDCGKKHLNRVPILPSYVEILDLIGNKLNDTTVLEIRNLAELKKLSLKRNQLDVFPKFTGLSSLRQLNLASNRIQRIPSEALAALPKLKTLDLSRNYLHTLEANYFPATIRLQHLLLNNNEIASIDENAFQQLSGLIELQLNSNRLLSLPSGVFKNLSKLTKLSLNNNHLEIIYSTFKGLTSMQKLSLQSNNIRALQDGIFYMMRGIESIELDHNKITSLSRQGLFNLTKLQHLSLSNNSISRIELDTWEFTQSLVSLDLSYNNISEFKPQHLDCLQQLRQLNLGHNRIQFFADNTFDCVKNLEDLNLKRNRLAWIVEDAGATPPFKALRKLKKLDLSGNNLKQINSKSLSGLNGLEELNLDGNALASVQSGAFEYMTHLKRVKFKSMNFICDCELLWFRRWLLSKPHAVAKSAICGYPDHLLDRELLSLSPAELICADSPKPIIIQEPANELAVNGANITMECIASSPAAASLAATDELKIKWRHDNQNLRERGSNNAAASTPAGPTQLHNHHHNPHHYNHHNSGNSHSYSTTETQVRHDQTTNQTTIIGYLRLYNVSYENAGRYQCVVSNAFGTTYSQKFKLSIGIHPTFLQIPSNLTIDSGGTARLVCSATGDPTPEIALQKFGASDFPAATERRLQVIREENAFVITNAKPIDTGIYTCTADSAAGEIKINASLIVNDKPQPIIPIVKKEVIVGSSGIVECLSDMAAEFQRPHREWFKDNKPFHTSTTSASERYYFTTEKELLVVMNAQAMDAGHYRCEITDDSKTQIIQTELIIVKANLSFYDMIVYFAAPTIIIVFVIVIIIFCRIMSRNRKSLPHASNASGCHGSTLDQTQLSTLNRTYLRPKNDQTLRPRSLMDLEMNGGIGIGVAAADAEQRSCLIVGSTPSYQNEVQHPALQHATQPRNYDGGVDTYLRRNSLYDPEYQQDHFSSKDSGTGSDAAVKRSIDDFTIALLPLSSSADAPVTIAPVHSIRHGKATDGPSPPRRASLARTDTYTDDIETFDGNEDDASTPRAAGSDPDLVTSPVLGISAPYPKAFELTESRRNGNVTSSSTTPCGSPYAASTSFEGGDGG